MEKENKGYGSCYQDRRGKIRVGVKTKRKTGLVVEVMPRDLLYLLSIEIYIRGPCENSEHASLPGGRIF